MLKATVIGNIGGDAETKQTKSGKSFLSFSVAHDKGKDQPTVWIRIMWFGGIESPIARFLRKGAKVSVTGDMNVTVYQDRTGSVIPGLDIYADSVEIVMYPKREDAAPAPAPYDPNHAPVGPSARRPAPAAPAGNAPGEYWGPGNPDYDKSPDFLKDDDLPV